MKRKIALITLVMLVMSILAVGCGSNQKGDTSMEDIKKKGKFVVGLDDTFAPMGFKDEKGEIVGFDIDLAKEVAKRMGIEVEFKPVEWDGIVLSLKNKDIDVIWNGLTITDERKKEINFSKVYLMNKQAIIVKSNSAINGKADLNGKLVGLQLGSSAEKAVDSDAETAKSLKEIKKYPNNTDALMDLSAGRVDAVVVDEIFGRYYTSKKANEYKVLEDNFGEETYGVGIRKEDVKFKEELDKALDAMKADGTAAEISKKWFGNDIVVK